MSVDPPFGGGDFIADTSIWARAEREQVREEWANALSSGQIATCPIVAFELLYSARTSSEYQDLEEELSVLRSIPVTHSVCSAVAGAMRVLAMHSDGYHRIPIADYLIAACAQEAGMGVLHYDGHFDRLSGVIGFESRWATPAGMLD